MNADRVSVLEMHNGKENPTSLPFLYCDMTYEETRDHVPYVAEEYEDFSTNVYGSFVGIGIYFGKDVNDNMVIIQTTLALVIIKQLQVLLHIKIFLFCGKLVAILRCKI